MLASVTTSAQTLYAATSGLTGEYPNKQGITLKAPRANTGIIYIGASNAVTAAGATTAGISLEPGDSVEIPTWFAADARALYVIASTGTQNLLWDVDDKRS